MIFKGAKTNKLIGSLFCFQVYKYKAGDTGEMPPLPTHTLFLS